jgi:hypothetical protein
MKKKTKEKTSEKERKKRARRKKEVEGRAGVSPRRISPGLTHGLASPDLAGSRRRPTVCLFVLFFCFVFVLFFFFSRSWVSQPHFAIAVPRRRSAQTPRSDPPRKKSTTGHQDLRLGLAGRGFGFFLVLG